MTSCILSHSLRSAFYATIIAGVTSTLTPSAVIALVPDTNADFPSSPRVTTAIGCLDGVPPASLIGHRSGGVLEAQDPREVTCTIHGTIDVVERELCITGGSCEGEGIKVTIELDDPVCVNVGGSGSEGGSGSGS